MRQLFGKVAVDEGYLSTSQLQQLLGIFGRENHPAGAGRRLGDLAVALGFMTQPQVDEVIAKQAQGGEQSTGAQPSLAASESPRFKAPGGSGTSGAMVTDLVRSAISARASDLHLHAGEPPFVRRAGRLVSGSAQPLPAAALETALLGMMGPTFRQRLETAGQVDLCVPFDEGYRLRMNVFKERCGLCASVRIIAPTLPTIERLNLPSAAAVLTTYHQGLVLVAGPAGCGKTTTLAALVDLINEQRPQHVVCLEDPIEFVYESKVATITQREIGTHTRSYGAALRAALREDPDIIVISELRDPEAISLALTAAETGHLVMGTIHTSSAVGTISRLIEAFAGDEEAQVRAMLAQSLRGVLCQHLVPTVGGSVAPMVELLVNNRAIGHCIRDNKLHQVQSLLQTGASRHTVTRADSLRALLQSGLITPKIHDAYSVTEE
ncbi:MAG: PilT/PilU family type 4a pilus ATPase [Myxococcota bacterium]|nr:PilT/PilU family type 4a pilus ATPase [Myxococcota bacterium]